MAGVLAFLAAGRPAWAGSFTYTTLDHPLVGVLTNSLFGPVQFTSANGINNQGEIVGSFTDAGGLHGFQRSSNGSTWTSFDTPGSSNAPGFPSEGTLPNGINSSGQIAGYYYDANSFSHGFTDLITRDFPGATYSGAEGINSSGQFVGYFSDGFHYHGFVHSGNTFTQFDVPGSTYTTASGINDIGQIVGTFTNGTGDHGFLRSADGLTYTTIDDPLGNYQGFDTWVTGINNLGQIVGFYYPAAGNGAHAFLVSANLLSFTDLTPNNVGAGTQADGINDLGQIVGTYSSGNTTKSFLATPNAPEPGTLFLFGTALAGLAWARRRRAHFHSPCNEKAAQ